MVKDYLKLTDDPAQIREIGKRLMEEFTIMNLKNSSFRIFYTPFLLEKMRKEIAGYLPDASEEERENQLYSCIYHYLAFGFTVDEVFYLKLKDKTVAEKLEYMPRNLRHVYVLHLNEAAGDYRIEQLEDKYLLYQRLAPYYKRDVIEVRSMDDYEVFAEFAKKHPVFVVKPADYSFGYGVHKASMEEYGNDDRLALESILNEGKRIQEKSPSRVARMVLEELIEQDESLAVLHRESVNGIRATAVRGKDGKIHIYHPWIKAGIGGTFVASAALNGFDAEIDPVTGIVISDGHREKGEPFKVHPDSGITIKGFQIPKWDELVQFVDEIMNELPEYGTVAWDLVLTPKGWCIMEGNYSGDFMFQMTSGRGFKKEYEELIGWKYDRDFWWEQSKAFWHN